MTVPTPDVKSNGVWWLLDHVEKSSASIEDVCEGECVLDWDWYWMCSWVWCWSSHWLVLPWDTEVWIEPSLVTKTISCCNWQWVEEEQEEDDCEEFHEEDEDEDKLDDDSLELEEHSEEHSEESEDWFAIFLNTNWEFDLSFDCLKVPSLLVGRLSTTRLSECSLYWLCEYKEERKVDWLWYEEGNLLWYSSIDY